MKNADENLKGTVLRIIGTRGVSRPVDVWTDINDNLVSLKAVQVCLYRLAAQGQVERAAHGFYGLPGKPASKLGFDEWIMAELRKQYPAYLTPEQLKRAYRLQHGHAPFVERFCESLDRLRREQNLAVARGAFAVTSAPTE